MDRVKSGKKNKEQRAPDNDRTQEDSGDGLCTAVVPKLNKMLRNINDMMTWLEHQTDSEHLHSLHLTSIKNYILKNAIISSGKLNYLFYKGNIKCKYIT
jgi:hypothetical protein